VPGIAGPEPEKPGRQKLEKGVLGTMEKLKISSNGRYFVKEDGTLFVWLADTTWTMPQRLKWDDAEYLMQKRKSQGFTVLQIVALDPERDVRMRNPAGDEALLDGNLDTPNEKYFAYLDWILDKAEEYGFYVLLLPVWGQLVVGDDWAGGVFPKTVTEENAYRYGAWIGDRYREKNHILWCLGGDRQPVHKGTDYRKVWRRMAEGLAKGLLGKDLQYNVKDEGWEELLITYHACHEAETGECSTLSYWDGEEEAWIRFVMLQSGHGLQPKNYELVAKEYANPHIRPVWDGEPAYEMMITTFPPVEDSYHGTWMVRRRAYWSLLSGSFGHTYGHASVWCSVGEKETDSMTKYSWYEALQSEGSMQMKHLREIMESLQLMACIPASVSVAGQDGSEEMNRHAAVSEHAEGRYVCAYLPSGGSVRLDLEKLPVPLAAEGLSAWWWNPSDGRFYGRDGKPAETAQAAAPEEGSLFLEAPTEGEEKDWVLILMTEAGEPPVKEQTYYEMKAEKGKKVFDW